PPVCGTGEGKTVSLLMATRASAMQFNEDSQMSVESFDPAAVTTDEAVTGTEAAVEHFRRQLAADSKAQAVHLSVKESGCTGFMYVVDLVAESASDDLRVPLAADVDLLIARASLPIVKGTRIDFVRE